MAYNRFEMETKPVLIVDRFGNPISSSNSLPVSLTGRNVTNDRVYLCKALAITDTNPYRFVVDTSSYSKFNLFVYHSLNQYPTIGIRINDASLSATATLFNDVYNGSSWGGLGDNLTLSTANMVYLLNTYYTWLNNGPYNRLQLDISCATAPTSGSITAYIEGVRS